MSDHGSDRPATVDDLHDIARSMPVVFWVDSEVEKEAILTDTSLPFFSTPHFNGHPSVLIRASRIGELSREELAGFVEGAWLARAGPRAVGKWLKEHA